MQCFWCQTNRMKNIIREEEGLWSDISPQWNDVIISSSAVLWLLVCLHQSNMSTSSLLFFSSMCVCGKKHFKRKFGFRPKPISFSNIRIKFSYLIGVTFEWNHQLAFLTLSHPNLQKVTQKYNLSFFFFLFFFFVLWTERN